MKQKNNSFLKGLYSLIFGCVGAIVIIWDLIDYLFYHSYLSKYELLYSEKAKIFISFFTQQSNIIASLYLFFCFYFHFANHKFDNRSFLIQLFITCYISVTSIVFTIGLLPSIIRDSFTYDLKGWIFTIFLHYINPLIMLIYYFWMSGTFYYKIKIFTKKSLYKIYIYPIFYFIYAMIRGEIRHNDWRIHSLYDKVSLSNFDLEYPYWFLNFHHHEYGIQLVVLAFLCVFSLLTSIAYLLIVINNFIFHKRQYKYHKMVKK